MTAPSYRHVAWAYDALASVYSLGAIDRAKAMHHRLICEGDHVLYAGAGRGREIVAACSAGAAVTCVEPCSAMASRLRRRLNDDKHQVTLCPDPIQSLPAEPRFDLAVAHFFLNVFGPDEMPGILEHLCAFVRPGGRLVIADFKPTQTDANTFDRLCRAAYYRPLNLAGKLLNICALHPIYDYAPLLIEHGFILESRTGLRVLPGPPELYDVIVAQRPNE